MTTQKIVLASGNQGKIAELRALLADLPYTLISQSDFGIDSIAETGLTFIENAILKARHAALTTGLPALADDSGLCIDALNGAPGIYSARYAGDHVGDVAHLNKALQALEGVPENERGAQFHCVLAFFRHGQDAAPIICHGIWAGRILPTGVGQQGFGYDPIFFDPQQNCSAAELDPAIKNTVSHRAQAIQQLRAALKTGLP